jgi:hypothetical protein
MKLTRRGLWKLRLPLMAALFAFTASLLGVSATRDQLSAAQSQLENQQQLLNQAQRRLRQSGEERDLIVKTLPRYQELEQAGFIGEEQRINWLDALRTVNRELRLFGVEYQIGPRQVTTIPGLSTGQFDLMRSSMKLSFQVLHEGDVLRFFDLLQRTNSGVFQLKKCALYRIDNTALGARFQPNLRAECVLDWLTMMPKSMGTPR